MNKTAISKNRDFPQYIPASVVFGFAENYKLSVEADSTTSNKQQAIMMPA